MRGQLWMKRGLTQFRNSSSRPRIEYDCVDTPTNKSIPEEAFASCHASPLLLNRAISRGGAFGQRTRASVLT